MSKNFKEYKGLNLPQLAEEVLTFWKDEKIFEKSIAIREGADPFVFFEGPPSANGLPGIHHVMARAIKDIFCRYKTQKGYKVDRKAGWDTHGLPIELGVEKELGITKEDIGTRISVEEYNEACKKAVMRYTDVWNQVTESYGYWVDMDDPYITYKSKYMETVWWILKQIWDKDLLYKGYTIQPYSPKAGTGLSSHELNMPGTYQDVTDTTVVAQFKAVPETLPEFLTGLGDIHFLAWTTTPWTLPSNTALTVGPKIDYVLLSTINRYTEIPINVVLAYDLVYKLDPTGFERMIVHMIGGEFVDDNKREQFDGVTDNGRTLIEVKKRTNIDAIKRLLKVAESNDFDKVLLVAEFNDEERLKNWLNIVVEDSKIKLEVISLRSILKSNNRIFSGAQLEGIRYEQLLPYALPNDNPENAFRVITGDFVTTEDGTGIVHTAPTFGADDAKVAKEATPEVPPMLVMDENENLVPLVDLQGRFRPEMGEFGGKYVKNEYYDEGEAPDKSVDVELAIKLKIENKAFKVEKYVHSYPNCWRTDKPILYYPLDSWFIKVTDFKERMFELNQKINWKPKATGERTIWELACECKRLEPVAITILGDSFADMAN